jgi:hypothetical protein
MIRSLAVAAGFLVAGGYVRAEKKVTVKISHSPSLAGALAGRLVTPGPLTGDCGKEFGGLVFQDMRAWRADDRRRRFRRGRGTGHRIVD